MTGDDRRTRLGWIGVGRMGRPLVTRLLNAGHDVSVFNRTPAKAQPLADIGATIVGSPAELADRDIVFTMVAGNEDVEAVVTGPDGLLSRQDVVPRVIVDSTTISPSVAADIRARGGAARIGDAGGAGERQPQGGGEWPVDDRGVGSRRRVAPGPALPGAPRPRA